jgi:uncharacterized protein
MLTGLTSRFNILQQSPQDFVLSEAPEMAKEKEKDEWKPSRYNIRATTNDGRLVLWNSYKGTMTIFESAQREGIEALLSRNGFSAKNEGIVKYLFERGFLVKGGTNEYRNIQMAFGQQHYRMDTLQFILLASEDCNFRCTYCYEDFARGTMKPWVREGIKNLVKKRLPMLRHLSVSWFGGEPLYGWEAIEDLAPFFCEIAEQNSLRYSTHMTTNGYLLRPEIAEKLLSWKINAFQITLDGIAENHNHSRPTRNGEDTFQTIFDNLRQLRTRPDDFLVELRVNFDKLNTPNLPDFLALVASEFKDDPRYRLRFRAVGQWGGTNDDQLEVCGTEESSRIQLELKAEARKRGLNLSDQIKDVQGLGDQVCYAARPYNFIIGASGKVMKCTIELDKQDRNVVGTLSEDGNLCLDESKMALWTEPAFESDSKCKKCVVLPACQGMACPLIRFESGNSPCTPLRLSAKQELREMADNVGVSSRRITID